jgi:flagellar biogenesis protein FliO
MRAWVGGSIVFICAMCAGAAPATQEARAAISATAEDARSDGPSRSITRDRSGLSTSQPTARTGTNPAAPVFDIKRVGYALAIVLGLIFAMRWGGKWLFPQSAGQRASRAVQVLARNVISPKQQLLVIRVGQRLIVVGDSGQQMNALCEITDPDETAALLGQIEGERREPIAIGRTFGSLFGRADAQYRSAEPSRSAKPENDEPDAELEPSEAQRRDELNGLMDRVRLMSQQFRRT